jgi:hypothetical protein
METKLQTIYGGEISVIDDEGELIAALQSLMPSERSQKSELFTKLFPFIEDAFARNVPQKDILAALSRRNLKLHPVRFKAMLKAERERSPNLAGTCCQTCGAVLPNSRVLGSHSASEKMEQIDHVDDDSQVIA